MTKLNNYFLSYWIGEITPEVFSVFGLINRTNNLVESWHRWLNERMGTSHLNPWDFLYFLKEAEDSKARDYLAESQNIRTTRSQPLAQRKRNEVIAKNEKDFMEGVISMREFLKKSRNLTEPELRSRNRADSPVRETIQPRRRFLAGTIRVPPVAAQIGAPPPVEASVFSIEPDCAPPASGALPVAPTASGALPVVQLLPNLSATGRPRRATKVPNRYC